MNLTGLNWLSDNEEYFPFLHCFCGPNLKTLKLSPAWWDVSKCVAVASLASSCPLLEEFLCPGADDFSMHAISEAVLGWNNLRLLHVGPVNEQALAHAASLETLQELHFSASSDPRSSMLEFCTPNAPISVSVPTPSFFKHSCNTSVSQFNAWKFTAPSMMTPFPNISSRTYRHAWCIPENLHGSC